MDNLLESNERTLVIFDSVCSGLAECLALVHADIRQMTEHRNRLAQLEHDQIQAKLIPTQELLENNVSNNNNSDYVTNNARCPKHRVMNVNSQETNEDPHHLAGLKLLDERLADSFSRALSLSEMHKSSISAKHQSNQGRASIFQVLLGKYGKSQQVSKRQEETKRDKSKEPADNRTVIDDINKQTRLAMQYSKQLEAHLLKVEDLKAKYEMHLKMGLVVKSVARAYLTGGQESGANKQRSCSNSLVINDTSLLGAHSSASSLNLSTWSSSNRHKARGKQHERGSSQQFVSTISLDSKHKRRLNLAKLISSSSVKHQQDSSCHHHQSPELMTTGSKRRVSSQSTAEPIGFAGNYAYDWTVPTESKYSVNDTNGSLSRSYINLNGASLKGSKTKKNQQAASKTTIKEFIENIDKIESEFELYMGTFMLSIEDIQGFARVCQGDVFEIIIKYSETQRFKTKISVLKDSKQKCDNRQTVFKARISDVLAVKAYECKGLGKRVLLGHKLCETRDLFTARSQLMTISLNQTGSIKLNLVVTWNPLHMAPNSSPTTPGLDLSHISLPPTPLSSTTVSSMSSIPSLNGTTTTMNIEHNYRSSHNNSPGNNNLAQQHRDSLYQTVDPTYGYYIPPPDYMNCRSG